MSCSTNTSSSSSSTAVVWKSLVEWIQQNGGYVHPSLELRSIASTELAEPSSTLHGHGRPSREKDEKSAAAMLLSENNAESDDNDDHRGVFCSASAGLIASGELLIRLPSQLAVDGHTFPDVYLYPSPTTKIATTTTTQHDPSTVVNKRNDEAVPLLLPQQRAVSPWLRCLAAYFGELHHQRRYEHTQHEHSNLAQTNTKSLYLKSLPTHIESIFSWSQKEIETYLAGTHPPHVSGTTTSINSITAPVVASPMGSSWRPRDTYKALTARWHDYIRPYLEHVQVLSTAADDDQEDFVAFERTECEDDTAEGNAPRSSSRKLLADFRYACQAISTRGFHLQPSEGAKQGSSSCNNTNNGSISKPDQQNVYAGPYLLPLIDLLNHSSNPRARATSLQHVPSTSFTEYSVKHNDTPKTRNGDAATTKGDFVMIAERDIAANEEVLHSYSNHLTASQFLATFGFVPVEYTQRALLSSAALLPPDTIMKADSLSREDEQAFDRLPRSPMIMSKAMVVQACLDVIEAGVPEQLALIMQRRAQNRKDGRHMDADDEDDDDEEAWDIDLNDAKSRLVEWIQEDFRIDASLPVVSNDRVRDQTTLKKDCSTIGDATGTTTSSSDGTTPISTDPHPPLLLLLSDALVTCACALFLPKCAYAEARHSLLDGSVMLQDYYLGKLVGTALLRALVLRMNAYTDIFPVVPKLSKKTSRHGSDADVDTADVGPSQKSCGDMFNLQEASKSIDVSLLKNVTLLRKLLHFSLSSAPLPPWWEGSDSDIDPASELDNASQRRLMYALTLRLDEMHNLIMLRNEVIDAMAQLDDRHHPEDLLASRTTTTAKEDGAADRAAVAAATACEENESKEDERLSPIWKKLKTDKKPSN